MTRDELKSLIRTIPDFPKAGIEFRDITTLLADGEGLAASIDMLTQIAADMGAQKVAGIDARGFIFGTALALRLGVGFVPLRKEGKLPGETISQDYALEYGQARLELDPSLVSKGERVLVVDDLLATGGTAMAGVKLLRRAGAVIEHALFVIDLPELGGGAVLKEAKVSPQSLIEFAGH